MSARKAPSEVRQWLRIADQDQRAAASDVSLVPWQRCFHAQQAAEKAIKAALTFLGVDFPWTHNLDALLALFPNDWRELKESRVGTLTHWAILPRYPGFPSTRTRDAQRALIRAERVVALVRRELKKRGYRARDPR